MGKGGAPPKTLLTIAFEVWVTRSSRVSTILALVMPVLQIDHRPELRFVNTIRALKARHRRSLADTESTKCGGGFHSGRLFDPAAAPHSTRFRIRPRKAHPNRSCNHSSPVPGSSCRILRLARTIAKPIALTMDCQRGRLPVQQCEPFGSGISLRRIWTSFDRRSRGFETASDFQCRERNQSIDID